MEIQVVRLRRRFRVKGQRKQKKYCMFRGTCYGKPYSWENVPIEAKQFDRFIQITKQIITRAAEIEAADKLRRSTNNEERKRESNV